MSGNPSSSSSAMGDLWIGPIPSPPPTPAPPEASLTTQERLRLAKRRRAAQLKRWTQRDAKGPNAPGSNGAPDIIQGRRMDARDTRPKFESIILLTTVTDQSGHFLAEGKKGLPFLTGCLPEAAQ